MFFNLGHNYRLFFEQATSCVPDITIHRSTYSAHSLNMPRKPHKLQTDLLVAKRKINPMMKPFRHILALQHSSMYGYELVSIMTPAW